MRIVELFWVLRAMRPGADWSWLDQIVERLRRRCRSTDLKPRAGVSAADVYRWAHECVF
jgi:hypothetical protein